MRRTRPQAVLAIGLLTMLVISTGCAGGGHSAQSLHHGSSWSTQQLLLAARNAANASMRAKKRADAKARAEEGLEYAERCLMSSPEEAGCYYWRAVNTGLYYRLKVIGYQKGIQSMIRDCEKVIALDASYDHAGPYRMLGQIYLKLPQSTGRPDSINRDLELAEKYLRKAVQLSPEYPENHLALAELFLEQDDVAGALEALSQAQVTTPQWKQDASYDDWRLTMRSLERKIKKTEQ